ncbi:MAG: HAD-IB family phosphatase [Vulcanimicrobiaceae bacterium]
MERAKEDDREIAASHANEEPADARAPRGRLAVFVDYDGTITDLDTFDVLVQSAAGPQEWARLESALHGGHMTLRNVLSAQAQFVRVSLDEADAMLARTTHFDPTFVHFVKRCEREDVPLTILSSGVQPLIERALERHGLQHVSVLANTVTPSRDGWTMHFRDGSDNGHNKAAAVRAATSAGAATIFAGDGHSDFEAALEADRRFAKRGRALERYLKKNGVEFTPFSSFAEVERALFER